MKRILCIVLFLVILHGCALADEPYFRAPEVVIARAGSPVSINCRRIRNTPDGVLMLTDASGDVLISQNVSRIGDSGKLTITQNNLPSQGQALKLVYAHDGQTEVQCEILLAIDDRKPGVTEVKTEEKKIAVTFDSTGSGAKAGKLLELLDRYGVKCTFFIQGGYLKEDPEKAVLISEHGHELGNHSMYHPDMREIGDEMILREIRECNDLIQKITGQAVRFYRPPGGYYTYRDRAISRALGCEMILWTFDSRDGFFTTPQEIILGRLYKKSGPGSIILMHDYGQYTVPVLEEYIPAMQAQGYRFVTVGELIRSGK